MNARMADGGKSSHASADRRLLVRTAADGRAGGIRQQRAHFQTISRLTERPESGRRLNGAKGWMPATRSGSSRPRSVVRRLRAERPLPFTPAAGGRIMAGSSAPAAGPIAGSARRRAIAGVERLAGQPPAQHQCGTRSFARPATHRKFLEPAPIFLCPTDCVLCSLFVLLICAVRG